ncbi:MAG: hypothetical protein LBJ08_06305, partial [Bifidobacteriaceae bacterium]|jgi:hypothetical protein|nr:hypothetical protein [Bifidobacteriaceae bacterium]
MFRELIIDRLAWLSQATASGPDRDQDRYDPPLPLTPKKPPVPAPRPSFLRRVVRRIRRRFKRP